MRQFFRVVSRRLSRRVRESCPRASQSGGYLRFKKDNRSHRRRQVCVVAQSAWTDLLSVRDEKGVETIWDAETASISILRNRGVDGSPVRVGDRVTIAGSPSTRARPEILRVACCCRTGPSSISDRPPPTSQPGKPGVWPPVQDRRRCRAAKRRSVPRLVDDHERPRRVSHVQRGLSADRRRKGRACEMESAQHVL